MKAARINARLQGVETRRLKLDGPGIRPLTASWGPDPNRLRVHEIMVQPGPGKTVRKRRMRFLLSCAGFACENVCNSSMARLDLKRQLMKKPLAAQLAAF